MDNLKILRSIITPDDLKNSKYKASTIRAVLYGQRKNNEILEQCIEVALYKISEHKKTLKVFMKSIQGSYTNSKQKSTPKKNTGTYTNNAQRNNQEKLKQYAKEISLPDEMDYVKQAIKDVQGLWTEYANAKKYNDANEVLNQLPSKYKTHPSYLDFQNHIIKYKEFHEWSRAHLNNL